MNCFATEKDNATPITFVTQKSYAKWLDMQPVELKNWLSATGFRGKAGNLTFVPNAKQKVARVIVCVNDQRNFWDAGSLPLLLPEGIYRIEESSHADAISWGLGAYQFTRYRNPQRAPAKLYLSKDKTALPLEELIKSLYLVRDLINTPTDDLGPTQLALAAKELAKECEAKFKQIVGEDLLKENYPCIYTVGRASDDAPRLLDIRWGNKKHPKVTLVGKGVCFDTGGLDLKSSSNMLLMKKDMGGAAHVLGLARMIMKAKLPICLRVLIPAVENAVSGNAYRPGDIIKSRKGLTVEIGNTDAEGRVVLADALTEAVSENPDLLIDMTTLTGAARIALGTDLPAVFSNDQVLVNKVIESGEKVHDLMWQLPLYAPYRELLYSNIADINNSSTEPYGGAITAALFLKDFVPNEIPWLHFDMMAWNLRTRAGRPQGGEALCLRALFNYLQEKFKAA